ncbi:MAG: diguanylate cyclase [Candidatus Schekmanbacteria bacterium]|nr:diguanylate cyclase [Candidatus Schekmanbacteria bacterium]
MTNESRNRILVVDDVAMIKDMVEKVLTEQGFVVSSAGDGAEALKAIRRDRPDLLILDWELPKLSGRDLCKILKGQASTKYIPVIMLTARTATRDVVEGLNTGADDYMTKPFNELELLARVRALFRLKELEYELEAKNRLLEQQNQELEQLATRDGLTRLFNHRHFQERLAFEYSRVARYGSPMSLILMDIDHFKRFNDTYGHMVGDLVLKQSADLVVSCVRECDIPARYGGEEFVVILPQCGIEDAATVAERIRSRFERNSFDGGESGMLTVTVSLGFSVASKGSPDSPAELIRLADEALYCAKRSGRNQVVRAVQQVSSA